MTDQKDKKLKQAFNARLDTLVAPDAQKKSRAVFVIDSAARTEEIAQALAIARHVRDRKEKDASGDVAVYMWGSSAGLSVVWLDSMPPPLQDRLSEKALHSGIEYLRDTRFMMPQNIVIAAAESVRGDAAARGAMEALLKDEAGVTIDFLDLGAGLPNMALFEMAQSLRAGDEGRRPAVITQTLDGETTARLVDTLLLKREAQVHAPAAAPKSAPILQKP